MTSERTWTTVLIEIYYWREHRWKSNEDSEEEEEDEGKESRPKNVDAAMQLVPVLSRWCKPAQCVSTSPGGSITLEWIRDKYRVTCSVLMQAKDREVYVAKYPVHGDPVKRAFPFSTEDSTNHETIAKTLKGFINDIMDEQKEKAAAPQGQQRTNVKVAFTHLTRQIIDEIRALAADHIKFRQIDSEPYKTVCALIERRIEILNRRAGGETIAEPTPDLADLVKQVIGK